MGARCSETTDAQLFLAVRFLKELPGLCLRPFSIGAQPSWTPFAPRRAGVPIWQIGHAFMPIAHLLACPRSDSDDLSSEEAEAACRMWFLLLCCHLALIAQGSARSLGQEMVDLPVSCFSCEFTHPALAQAAKTAFQPREAGKKTSAFPLGLSLGLHVCCQ